MENQPICQDCAHHRRHQSAEICDDCFVKTRNFKSPIHHIKKMDTPKLDQPVFGAMTKPGYERLATVLNLAYEQAAFGKGSQRHATGQPFHEQPMQSLIRLHGLGFATGQASKKAQEAQRMDPQQAIHELLGAINYLAGAIISIQDKQ